MDLIDTAEEKEKFISLYNTYKDLLYWIALKRTGNIQDAEECVQETFFYIASHLEKIDCVESKRTKSYLSTIVAGFAADRYNKTAPISFDDEASLHQSKTNDSAYFDRFDAVELSTAIDVILNENDKIYFYLKYIYGYKSREIAQLYNVKDSFVRKRLQYAKNKLREYLSKED